MSLAGHGRNRIDPSKFRVSETGQLMPTYTHDRPLGENPFMSHCHEGKRPVGECPTSRPASGLSCIYCGVRHEKPVTRCAQCGAPERRRDTRSPTPPEARGQGPASIRK